MCMLNAEFTSDATSPLTVRYEAISKMMEKFLFHLKILLIFQGRKSQATDKNGAEWLQNLKIQPHN